MSGAPVDIRLARQAELIHGLGPRPLAELLGEILARHPELAERIEKYAAANPHIIRALGADTFAPRLVVLPGGRP